MRPNVLEHWPMYLMATVPLGGFIVAFGSAGYVVLESGDDEIARETRWAAVRLATYGALTTLLWLLVSLVA